MRHNKYIFFSLILLGVALGSCKKDTPPNFHFEYMGNTEGRYIIYDVVDIVHDDGAIILHDTSVYQLKTVWGEYYKDNLGRNCRLYRRYTRNDASFAWSLKDTWYGLIDGIRGELVEENQRVVKLVFSPTKEKEWDANAYNQLGQLNCFYEDIHKTKIFGGVSFDSTVVVEQAEEQNAIIEIRKYEVYAKSIGLVYKLDRDLDYQLMSLPQNGKELTYIFVSAGFE